MRCLAQMMSIPVSLLTVAFLSIITPHDVSGAEPSGVICDCSLQQGPCTTNTGSGLQISLAIEPRPIIAMNNLTFRVTVAQHGLPVNDATVLLDLSMPGMFMGANRPRLVPSKPGLYVGTGVITRCMSGKKTWKAEVSIERHGSVETVEYVFEVQ